MDLTTWEFINSFSPWLSAIGTIAAVVVSLHLAGRDRRIRLQVSAGVRLLVSQGLPGNHREFLVIRVVNIGHREAQVTNIGWKVGLFKRKYAVQTTISGDGLSSNIPVRLRDGAEASYYIPLQGIDWLENFTKDFLDSCSKLRARFIKVTVHTSVGVSFDARIEKGLRKRLLETARNSSRK